MLRYANSDQAGLAGDFVGAAYRDTFRNPEDLIELAQILRGSQQNSAARRWRRSPPASSRASAPRTWSPSRG